ncbi:FG-GAP-like repeat-containing protein [Streptomyces sp. NPDC020965]|uniref:FG-GAP-like repeat-containing protein n=1 Tax=Streptomyces sp. NPDC020965 TaxID=3365105 RepID=UPI0037AD436E
MIRPAAAVLAVLTSAAVLSGPNAQAAVGTPAAAGSFAFAAKLDIGSGAQARICSGALIDPHWVATAASCFAANPKQPGAVTAGKPTLKTTVTVGRTSLTGTGGVVTEILEVLPRGDRDLVLARLAEPAHGITPVAVAGTDLAAGEQLKVAGYGRTKTEWISNRLHTADFTVGSLDATTARISGVTANDAICTGDAGAPILRTVSGRYELVGLSSRSWQGGCLNETETRNSAIAARTDNTTIGNRLTPGTRLLPGETLISNSAKLGMKADGNLVITSNAGKTLWSTGTVGNPGAFAAFGTDGNLTVTSADGTRILWESNTTAAGGYARLHNRGNLVVHNAQHVTQWSSGTVMRHDYNGDGFSDLAAWYDYDAGNDAVRTFQGAADARFDTPAVSYEGAAGDWNAAQMKRTTGDFNGDGRGDIAALYGYSDGRVKAYTWLGRHDGTFGGASASWETPAGNWTFSRVSVQAGDFNGDGRDDLAAWYDYADGSDKLFTFTAQADGGFNAPFSSFTRDTGWSASSMKFATGDYNADGHDDIGAFYGYADGRAKLFTFTAKPDGGFNDPSHNGWESADWGSFDRTSVHSGDFDGDGRDDIATWYDYADGSDAVVSFSASGSNGLFGNRREIWSTPAGNYNRPGMKIVTGDYNGDGRDDIGALYGYSTGIVKGITWTAKADGALNGPVHGWESAPGSWNFDNVTTIERYSTS